MLRAQTFSLIVVNFDENINKTSFSIFKNQQQLRKQLCPATIPRYQ